MAKKVIVFAGLIIIVVTVTVAFLVNETSKEQSGQPATTLLDTGKEPTEAEIQQAKEQLGLDNHPTADKLMDVVHKMTHQKVRADEKWGYIQMTRANILAVHEAIEDSAAENKDVLLGITSRWMENDFSNIVEGHNAVWKLQEGSVGKAEGILSESEEKEIIAEQFE